jgi:hypothetical protein
MKTFLKPPHSASNQQTGGFKSECNTPKTDNEERAVQKMATSEHFLEKFVKSGNVAIIGA